MNFRVITKQNNQLKAKYEMLKKNESSYEYVYELLEIAEGFETELTDIEKAQVMGNLFPAAVLYKDYLLLKAEFKGVPLELKIPIDDDPYSWHFTKQK
jgi:site-specific DNA recombinase